MGTRDLLRNIERLLAEKKVSADAISRKAGRADAIRNLRRYVSGDIKGSWTLETLEAVAEALEIEPWVLLKPARGTTIDPPTRDEIVSIIRAEMNQAPNGAKTPKRAQRK